MIGFVGLSHLGIVYSLATAAKGFPVLGYDSRAALCDDLKQGRFPIAEPSLAETFAAHRGCLTFTSQLEALESCEVIFLSLDVPTDAENRSDLAPLEELAAQVLNHMAPGTVLVLLSQVPPGFTRSFRRQYRDRLTSLSARLYYQVETLVFGNALERALKPERFIVGCEQAAAPWPAAYERWLKAFDCPVLPIGYESAELSKIAINLFLVSSVTTTNTIAELCEKVGAEWSEIAPALRLDRRIGPHAYLSPGLGIAGGNLERDLVTFRRLADERGSDASAIAAWLANSAYRKDWVLRQLHGTVLARKPMARLALWGLAYKAHTHSTKNSPSLALMDALPHLDKRGYDPEVRLASVPPKFVQTASALEACDGADTLLIMTPWPVFRDLDLAEALRRMQGRVVIDPFGVRSTAECAALDAAHFCLGAPERGIPETL